MDNTRLAQTIEADGELLGRWMSELLARSWTLRGRTPAQRGRTEWDGRQPQELLRERCGVFLQTLTETLKATPRLEIGTEAFREPVQILSFTAGWMAGDGLAITDALGLVHSLQAVLAGPPLTFFQSLAVVVSEAYAAAMSQKAQARYRDAMEKSQLVCLLHPSLPCLFLVGDPDLQAVDDALGRLMMLAVMRDAPAVIVDGSGLFDPDKVLRNICAMLSQRSTELPAKVCVSGASSSLVRELSRASAPRLAVYELTQGALAAAAGHAHVAWPVPA
jgi:hypothetical protein